MYTTFPPHIATNTHLLCNTFLSATIRLAFLHGLQYSPRSSASIGVHHELRVAPRHHLDILVNSKCVVELSGRLCLAVLDIADLTVDADLYASPSGLRRAKILVRLARDERWIGVHDCRGEIQDASDWYRILECRGIERDEGRAAVSKGCSAAEGKLESLLEQESTEDHEVMPR